MATAKDVLSKLAALAGENEAVVGQNNTTVNKYFNAPGQPYCGYSIWYACKKAGSNILNGCSNPAYVPTLKSYLSGKGWKVSNSNAKAGDIFVYAEDHVGFVYESVSGNTVITLEGNNGAVKKTLAEAKNGTGTSFEGIGYRKLTLTSAYTVYRPAYDGASSTSSVDSGGTAYTDANYGTVVTIYLNLLKQGHEGPEVKTVQRILNAAGQKVDVDGKYGPATKSGVKNLQKTLFPNEASEWDGEVGAKTWNAMLKELS